MLRKFFKRNSSERDQERQPLRQNPGSESSASSIACPTEAEERSRFQELFGSRMGGTRGPLPQNVARSSSSGPARPVVLNVIRSSVFADGETEDEWQVEVDEDGTVADVKRQIEELYQFPMPYQRLQVDDKHGTPCFEDSVDVRELQRHARIYLHPQSPEDMGEIGNPTMLAAVEPEELAAEHMLKEEFMAAIAQEQENRETLVALLASLDNVTYNVRFLRPQSAGGVAAGKSVVLQVGALALVGDVQDMVEMELFGRSMQDTEGVALCLNDEPLPLDAPLHFVGVTDGVTVVVAAEIPRPEEKDSANSFDDAVQSWARDGSVSL